DRIADMAHFVRREQRTAGIEEIRAVAVLQRRDAFDAAEPGGLNIGAGIDREHAGQALCRGRVDTVDLRMRMRRAQEGRIGLAARALVIDIAAGASDEAHILAATHRLADSELTHVAALLILFPSPRLRGEGGARRVSAGRVRCASTHPPHPTLSALQGGEGIFVTAPYALTPCPRSRARSRR